ncbi:MAG: YfhO family protein [Chloroflexi bacterium]|nr:YfhO family protein [Chloroflexota bacterium]
MIAAQKRMARLRSRDTVAVVLLVALWALFFWRFLTPVEADQVSFTQGDFSAQFFAFAGYQYTRFAEGQIPLWNPFNNGGLPFIADTQAAVFYPPRLLTLALANLSGGWSYHALELEVMFHVLAYTLLMYAFVRRLTNSPLGGLAAALIAGYGGFLTGYPLLQLAILEAGLWLPVAALGILEATEATHATSRVRWTYLLWTGFALGMSWLAGHPQTSFFLTYLLVAFYGFRVYQRHLSALTWVLGTALFGTLAAGLAAVQLLPGIEYLSHTTRVDFGFDAKDNGFPLQDVVQFVVPAVFSQWSPLYVGVSGVILALIGAWKRWREAWFWSAVVVIAVLWSFGGNAAVFPALYNVMPGLRFFRGQERAAYLVASGLAVMAGIGVAVLAQWASEQVASSGEQMRRMLARAAYGAVLILVAIFIAWLSDAALYGKAFGMISLSTAAVVVSAIAISILTTQPRRRALVWVPIGILAFELLTVHMNFDAVVDPIPPAAQISTQPPEIVSAALADTDGVFRVDGARGLTGNMGSLYGLQDIRGISPLWMAGPYTLVESGMPAERAWELFAVRYIFTDWQELPVPSQIETTGNDAYGPINLHRLSDPRPFALVMHDVWTVSGDEEAYGVLRDPAFQPRQTVILDTPVALEPGEPTPARVVEFEPERIVFQADTTSLGVLSIALPHYPGWQATLNGEPVDLLRAYGALSAVSVPAGSNTIELLYNPASYQIGLLISGAAWLTLGLAALFALSRRFIRHGRTQSGSTLGRAG